MRERRKQNNRKKKAERKREIMIGRNRTNIERK
jgi:hypothetical protein